MPDDERIVTAKIPPDLAIQLDKIISWQKRNVRAANRPTKKMLKTDRRGRAK